MQGSSATPEESKTARPGPPEIKPWEGGWLCAAITAILGIVSIGGSHGAVGLILLGILLLGVAVAGTVLTAFWTRRLYGWQRAVAWAGFGPGCVFLIAAHWFLTAFKFIMDLIS